MTPQEHNRLISIFFHVQGGLQVLGGLMVAVIYGGMGGFFLTAGNGVEQQLIGGIFIIMAIFVAVLVFLFAALDFYAGYKVGKVQPIGRTLGIVVAILSLLSFPLGTALGVYALWFFFGDMGKALYNVDGAGGQFDSPPPPPNSWQ
ncbi:MAG TPA: hypothetical protein DEP46_11235 [Blastocatellia bacterium]|nr:hypothetical protein [Blastocatellia bacterium]